MGPRNEMPFQLGISVTNNSLRNLFHYLKEKYKAWDVQTTTRNHLIPSGECIGMYCESIPHLYLQETATPQTIMKKSVYQK
ncbi:hypothetical protein PR048_001770 [Dryococelus australis]|uniref:Uncharacterized protein n=1 Tax=Dryococelus australis TaxID=614101 RepID=A0ABQ9IIF8_9NEOP|nr:hypothetical protein PR048_001770 [Dryococelus australis]